MRLIFRKSVYLLVIFTILTLFSACSSMKGSAMPKDGTYTWISGAGLQGLEQPVEITIAEGRLAGNGPLNRWTTNLDTSPIGPVAATRMAGPPELMDAEQRFFIALEGSTVQMSSAGNLEFVKDKKTVLEFKPVN